MHKPQVIFVCTVAMFLALCGTASAAVTASEDATVITVTGTTGNDVTVLSDDAANVKITNATAGANCVQSGTDALCARGSRTITASLLGGKDNFTNNSVAEANVSGGEDSDQLAGRLRSAQGDAGVDLIRTTGMTGVVSLTGGADFDTFDIGADTAASDIVNDTAPFMVDYLSRPAASGGVTLTPNNTADDGKSGEFDNIGGATRIRGTTSADNIGGTSGNDTLQGAAGVDAISAGDADDLVIGGPGTDTLQGGNGNDTLSFADDTTGVNVDLAGGPGQEGANSGFENVIGSPFDDTIKGTSGANTLNGAVGTDTVSYAGRTTGLTIDLASGTAGSAGVVEDTLASFENATGTSGNDVITGTPAANLLQGGDGNDSMNANLGPDFVVGGNGVDELSFDYLPPASAGTDVGITHTIGGLATGNSESDISLEIESLTGSKRHDVLAGTNQNESLDGGDGDDRLIPGPGSDTARGGAGIDTLDYSASPVAIHAHLNAVGGLSVQEFATTPTVDTLTDEFENVTGSAFADVLRGSDQQANRIAGGGGNDVIDGRNGDDTMNGDSGNDRFGRVSGSVQETATAAQVTVGNSASGDGQDTVLAGSGNDDVNLRDAFLDNRIDCGTGTDISRQDLVDDDGDLDIDNCETIETTAVDQRMTIVASVRKAKGRLRVRLSCPRKSKVACKGVAGRAKKAEGKSKRRTRYSVRRGRKKTITVRGTGKFLVLREKDQKNRRRVLSRRI